jgi:hypothetical protein
MLTVGRRKMQQLSWFVQQKQAATRRTLMVAPEPQQKWRGRVPQLPWSTVRHRLAARETQRQQGSCSAQRGRSLGSFLLAAQSDDAVAAAVGQERGRPRTPHATAVRAKDTRHCDCPARQPDKDRQCPEPLGAREVAQQQPRLVHAGAVLRRRSCSHCRMHSLRLQCVPALFEMFPCWPAWMCVVNVCDWCGGD